MKIAAALAIAVVMSVLAAVFLALGIRVLVGARAAMVDMGTWLSTMIILVGPVSVALHGLVTPRRRRTIRFGHPPAAPQK